MIFSKKVALALSLVALLSTAATAEGHKMSQEELVELGKEAYNNKSKGNCIACHVLPGAGLEQQGNLGPNLEAYASMSDDYLYSVIWDPNELRPLSTMPQIGRNHRASEMEIKGIIAYIKHTVNTN